MQQKNICSCQQLLHTLAQIVSTDLPITGGFQSFSIPSWQLTQYNIFDPQQLCQGRGGLNCQVRKVIVEDSQSVSQCFTAAQSYWEQSTKSFNPSMPDIFHLETRQKCLLALQTANCSRYSQGNIQMPDIPNKLSLTLWYPEAVRLSNSATSKQLRKCTILTSAVNSGTWLFYSSLHLGLRWRFLQADTNMDTLFFFHCSE